MSREHPHTPLTLTPARLSTLLLSLAPALLLLPACGGFTFEGDTGHDADAPGTPSVNDDDAFDDVSLDLPDDNDNDDDDNNNDDDDDDGNDDDNDDDDDGNDDDNDDDDDDNNDDDVTDTTDTGDTGDTDDTDDTGDTGDTGDPPPECLPGEACKCFGLTPEEQARNAVIDFGYVNLGDEQPRGFPICNCLSPDEGTATLKLVQMGVAPGPDRAHFSRYPEGIGSEIGPGECIEVKARYAPLERGTHSAQFNVVTSDTKRENLRIALRGKSLFEPDCRLTLDTLEYAAGRAQLGAAPLRTLHFIRNDGLAKCNVALALDPTGSPAIALANPPSATELSPGASIPFNLVYTPAAIGTDIATLVLESNDPDGAVQRFVVRGTAFARNDGFNASLDFNFTPAVFTADFLDQLATQFDFRALDIALRANLDNRNISAVASAAGFGTAQYADWSDIRGKNLGTTNVTTSTTTASVTIDSNDALVDDDACYTISLDYLQDCAAVARDDYCMGDYLCRCPVPQCAFCCAEPPSETPFDADPVCEGREPVIVNIYTSIFGRGPQGFDPPTLAQFSFPLFVKGDRSDALTVRRKDGAISVTNAADDPCTSSP